MDDLLSGRRTIIDVRAPGEFAKGNVPGSLNLPILSDAERAKVGTAFKQQGAEAARELGHRLVSGRTRQSRIDAWVEAATAEVDPVVCCWRGGERSQIAQRWLAERGLTIERVAGGYKALRQHALATLDRASSKPVIILAGRTGSGKTTLLHRIRAAIDLEGLANHRGSAFGSRGVQPAPATFENALAGAWLQHQGDAVVLEDESKLIGRVALPTPLFEHMAAAPVVLLDVDMATRVNNIRREYVDEAVAEDGAHAVAQRYLNALDRIRKRLGGVDHQALRRQIEAAFTANDIDLHHGWIQGLLERYYDPMYDYQLANKRQRIIFEGDPDAVVAVLADPGRLQPAA